MYVFNEHVAFKKCSTACHYIMILCLI